MDILIKDLMTAGATSTGPDTGLLEVAQTLRDERQSCMVIVEQDAPIGIVTERDLTKALARILETGNTSSFGRISDIMSSPPVTVAENETLFEALVVARSEKIRHLPVVGNNGKLIGMLTHSNLAQAHFQVMEQHRLAMENSVQERTAELVEANEQLKALSLTDTLMGIGNRRSMEVDLDHTLASAVRYQRPCCIALLDIDFFKKYNDHYGHQAGDDALVLVADHIQAAIRSADRLYRYGGEELLLLMPETDLETAAQVVERLVESLAQRAVPHRDSPLGVLTISAGVAGIAPPMTKPESRDELITRADQLLYAAKEGGRNRSRAA